MTEDKFELYERISKENMEFKFIELDFFPEFRTELDSIQIPMFKKIYSKFNFLIFRI